MILIILVTCLILDLIESSQFHSSKSNGHAGRRILSFPTSSRSLSFISKKRKILQNACLKAGFQPHEHVSRSHMDSDSTQNHGVTNTPIQVRVISIVHFRSLESQDHDRTMTETRPKYTLSRQLVTRSCSVFDFVTSDDCGHQAWRDHLALCRNAYLGQANPVEQ